MGHYDKQEEKKIAEIDLRKKRDQALRYNQGKPQYSLICLKSLENCAKVLEFGADKYGRYNWRKGMKATAILDSMLRHIAALNSGELIDPESGISHIGHIQSNAMFLGGPNVILDFPGEKC